MQSVNYAMNEGYKLSWKLALVGGAVGTAVGYAAAQDMVKKDPSSGILACAALAIFPFLGFTAGTLGGFVLGTAKGGIDWAISGPFEPHSQDDASIEIGAHLTNSVAELVFKGNNDVD